MGAGTSASGAISGPFLPQPEVNAIVKAATSNKAQWQRRKAATGYLPSLARAISARTRSSAVPPVARRALTEASTVIAAKMSSSKR
jgi:hypothetical protein